MCFYLVRQYSCKCTEPRNWRRVERLPDEWCREARYWGIPCDPEPHRDQVIYKYAETCHDCSEFAKELARIRKRKSNLNRPLGMGLPRGWMERGWDGAGKGDS